MTTHDPGTAPLLTLAEGYHRRTTEFLGLHRLAGHLLKLYAIEAPGRTVAPRATEKALELATDQLRLDRHSGSVGLACGIVHAGGDGDYVLVHTWIEGYMSRLAVFTGPAGAPESMRPAPAGLAPCVWEAAVLGHERTVYVDRVLAGEGTLADRVDAWSKDVLPTLEGGR
ncbi:hypothetical protein [Streptomyces cucumeris]|uniref:hypothetical protein n=1 Tax=Streptomyces cucumeris TaxID=2962890 RepID=UPI003D75BF12